MQSDEENFEESLETQTPERKTDPEDRYSLRRTPAKSQSEKQLEAKMDQQKLFEDLCKDSAAKAQNPSTAGFAFGGMSSSSAEPSSTSKNYTPKEKADRLQEMKNEEANVEKEFPNELFDICGAEPVEEVRLIDIPFQKGKHTTRRSTFSTASKSTSSERNEQRFTQPSREERKP